jgi:hypothetical protein
MIDDPSVRYRYDMEYNLEKGCLCMCCYERTGRWRVYDWLDKIEDEFYDSEEEAQKRCDSLNEMEKDFDTKNYQDSTSLVTGKLYRKY